MKRISNLIILLFIASILSTGCGDGSVASNNSALTVKKGDLAFSETDIYDATIVQQALEKSTEDEKTKSATLLEQAATQSGSKKTTTLLNAILAYPSAENFFVLGQEELINENFDNAAKAFDVATQLGYSDLGSLNFQKAVAYSNKNDNAKAIQALTEAIKGGFNDKATFLENDGLAFVRGTQEYMALLADNFTVEDGDMFKAYLSSFPVRDLPFNVGVNELNETADNEKYMGTQFENFVPEIRDALYSEEDGDDIMFTANLGERNGFQILLYSGKKTGTNSAAFYIINTYNAEGDHVDNLLFADKEDWDEIHLGTIDSDIITIETSKVTSFGEPEEDGAKSDKIVSVESISTETYTINEKGKFVKNK